MQGDRSTRFGVRGRGIGDANCIMFRDGVIQGVKDPRADGTAVGF